MSEILRISNLRGMKCIYLLKNLFLSQCNSKISKSKLRNVEACYISNKVPVVDSYIEVVIRDNMSQLKKKNTFFFLT